MRRRTWALLFVLAFLATFPVYFLYRQLGAHLALEDDTNFVLPVFSSVPRNASRTEEKECVQFFGDMSRFPDCLKRIQWMRAGWTTHRCYADYGVDGSFCSIRRYLSEVEKHCPRVAEETNVEPTVDNYAEERTDLSLLLSILQGKAENYDYIKNRLSYHWSRWVEAFHIAKSKYPNSMSHRRKMNILIHLGLLSEPSVGIGAKSRSGGPLGELLQWSDLIASLFLLGHNLYISTDKTTLMSQIDEFATNEPCPVSGKYIDLIITDIIGLRSFKRRKDFLLRNKCRIRLVDSFGTHVEYNYKSYFNAHQKDLKGLGGGNPWGGHGLQLLQHWTFFPHTPDNDFLGFAVHQSNVKPLFQRKSRSRPACLIYGKEKYMWEKSEAGVAVLKNLMEVHATVADVNATDHPLFSGIINHGFLNVTQIEALLKSVDIFVGLGFPYEGPAPLEAIANGAVFINPKFEPAHSRFNTKFFREKPTRRELSSQSPYLERLGAPYVYSVKLTDKSSLEDAIKLAVKHKSKPFVPEEFTAHGMLIRVNMLVNRDLCSNSSRWPPRSELLVKLAAPGESCVNACESYDLVCEPSFFPLVNTAEALSRANGCMTAQIKESTEPHSPYNCTRQSSPLMFSCASSPSGGSGAVRVCPCRDHIPGQIALCKKCVS